MKRFLTYFAKSVSINSKFAVRTIVKGNTHTLLPMVKAKGVFGEWIPIVKIYNRYEAMSYEIQGGLSKAECIEHIVEYQRQLQREDKENVFKVNYELIQ